MEDKLIGSIDQTIEMVCAEIKGSTILADNYADTIKALATLIEARAKSI